MKRFLVVLLLCGLAASVFAGGAQEAAETEVSSGEKYVIYAVVHGGIADPPWELNQRGAQACADHFPDLELHYVGPTSYDLEEFISYVESAIAADPDGLVVTLTAPETIDEILRPVIADGLPVIGINAFDSRSEGERIPVDSYVGLSNFYDIGAVAAETLMKERTLSRGVYCNHHPGAAHIDDSAKGFVETLEKNGIPAEQIVTPEDPIQAAEITISYLKANPEVDALLQPNATHLQVLVTRLDEEGIIPGEDILLYNAFDPTLSILELQQQGKIVGSNDQQMYLQGFYGVLFAYMKAKHGFEPPLPPVRTGPMPVTKEDAPELMELIEKGYR